MRHKNLCASVSSVGEYYCRGQRDYGKDAVASYISIVDLGGSVYSVCFVGAVLALASGKAERRQLHPLELHPLEVCNKVAEYFSELCQRLFFS